MLAAKCGGMTDMQPFYYYFRVPKRLELTSLPLLLTTTTTLRVPHKVDFALRDSGGAVLHRSL